MFSKKESVQLPVYLDNNSTTACDPQVVETMLPFFTKHFGNAGSRTHARGWEAKAAVDMARQQVADLIGAETEEIIFTSGATEAINLALKGVAEMYAVKGNHIITATTEHKAVLDCCKTLEKKGADITYLQVDDEGLINFEELEKSIRVETILIVIMFANNETGVIQDIEKIGAIAKKKNVIFFSDATQAVGKIPVDVVKQHVDLMALSAHKLYGPKGVGTLYKRRKNPRVRLVAQMDGGGHENGNRSGTLNVPGIAGLGKACAIAEKRMAEDAIHTRSLISKLENELMLLGDVTINGNVSQRLPNTTNLSFGDTDANTLITRIAKQVAVSSGSACTSALPEPSHVLKAMGRNDDEAYASLRFGVGRFTTEEEISFAIDVVKKAVNEIRTLKTQHSL